jgi:hypothetical protein
MKTSMDRFRGRGGREMSPTDGLRPNASSRDQLLSGLFASRLIYPSA